MGIATVGPGLLNIMTLGQRNRQKVRSCTEVIYVIKRHALTLRITVTLGIDVKFPRHDCIG